MKNTDYINTEFDLFEEHPKPVPRGMQAVSPAAELAVVMKRATAAKKEWDVQMKRKEREENQILAELATRIFLMEKALERFEQVLTEKELKHVFREFRVLKNQMRRTLEEAGVSTVDPTGWVLDQKLAEKVEILGWVSISEAQEIVESPHTPTGEGRAIKLFHLGLRLGQIWVGRLINYLQNLFGKIICDVQKDGGKVGRLAHSLQNLFQTDCSITQVNDSDTTQIPDDRVKETHEPIVLRHGSVIKLGQVTASSPLVSIK